MTKYRNTELSYPLSVCVCQKVISKLHNLISYWLKKLNQSSHWLGQSPKIDAGERDEGQEGGSSSYCLQILMLIAIMGVKTNLSTRRHSHGHQRESWRRSPVWGEACTLCSMYNLHVFIVGYLYYLLRVIGSGVLYVGTFQLILAPLLWHFSHLLQCSSNWSPWYSHHHDNCHMICWPLIGQCLGKKLSYWWTKEGNTMSMSRRWSHVHILITNSRQEEIISVKQKHLVSEGGCGYIV